MIWGSMFEWGGRWNHGSMLDTGLCSRGQGGFLKEGVKMKPVTWTGVMRWSKSGPEVVKEEGRRGQIWQNFECLAGRRDSTLRSMRSHWRVRWEGRGVRARVWQNQFRIFRRSLWLPRGELISGPRNTSSWNSEEVEKQEISEPINMSNPWILYSMESLSACLSKPFSPHLHPVLIM